MSLSVESYWPLLLAPAVLFLFWVRRRTETSLSGRHLAALTLVRSAVALMLLVTLMRPHLNRPSKDISAVFAVDVSRSIAPEFLSAAIQWCADAVAEGRPAHARFIGFAGDAAIVERADELGRLAVYDGGSVERGANGAQGVIDQSRTNIERALRQAMGSFSPHSLKRLVLITDGHETEGDLSSVLPELEADAVRVFTMPAAVRSEGDSWIERIEVPNGVRANEMVEVGVVVFSRVPKEATVGLETPSARLAEKPLTLPPGFSRVSFEVRLPDEGIVDLLARIDTATDPFPGNDQRLQTVSVGPAARILYVEGHPPSAPYFRSALESAGFEVVLVPGVSFARSGISLGEFDAIVLSDVSAGSLDERIMLELERYVRDQDGGLIFAAGETSYGEKGYSDTIVERVLPVQFRVEEKWKDLSLVVVLDKSYSMYGRKIALAKEATKAALDLLEDTHRFGVVTFDWNPYTTIPLQTASNKEWIKEGISRIQASAQTNIYPALERAYEQLIESPSKVKHVILLSDGKTYPDDYEELVKRMVEDEITVSTVAVGEEADQELLADIADWGNGRSYFILDAEKVQQIFIEETQIALEATLVEEAFKPVLKREIEALRDVDFDEAPALRGYVSTLPKEGAEVVLEARDEDPLLARWHYGLGWAVMFTSDVKNRWATDWLTWEGYGRFWAQIVRETMRRQHGAEVDFRVERKGDAAEIDLSVVDEKGEYPKDLEPVVRVSGPSRDVSTVRMRQTAPGQYHASVAVSVSADAPWRFELSKDGLSPELAAKVGGTRSVSYSYPDEYRFYPPDLEKLETIARETGGQFRPEAADIFSDHGERARVPTDLWPITALLGLLLYLLDIAMRRAPWLWQRLTD
ncbi:MAG TPA: VWA domain-containing protein [Vicinamibacteria bacterium]|nr:VWA domain-containing protein [Vicinamibacteria bacterium]